MHVRWFRKRSLFKRVVFRLSRKLADVQPAFAMISQDRSVELNPYESPIHCGGAKRLPPSRQPLLTLLVGIFGVASSGLALLIAVESISIAQRQGYDVEFTKGMIVEVAGHSRAGFTGYGDRGWPP